MLQGLAAATKGASSGIKASTYHTITTTFITHGVIWEGVYEIKVGATGCVRPKSLRIGLRGCNTAG